MDAFCVPPLHANNLAAFASRPSSSFTSLPPRLDVIQNGQRINLQTKQNVHLSLDSKIESLFHMKGNSKTPKT